VTDRSPAGDGSATNPWDEYADWYAATVLDRERSGDDDPLGILPRLLELLGDLRGRTALDAGCGEGYLARVMARHGARVTGVDLSPRLIEIARERDPTRAIDYRVADLCCPLPGFDGHFNIISSYLVLNDVHDHRGFAATLATALKPGGRLVLALNNPYSSVVRTHVRDYFASGVRHLYQGMSSDGRVVHYYHRTLEDYLDAFLATGLRLTKLVDLPRIVNDDTSRQTNPARPPLETLLPEGYQFPFFMLLAFEKPLQD